MNEAEDFSRFHGVYRGLSPTDESAIVMGELEITIDNIAIKYRMATGLEIEKHDVPLDSLKLMSAEDLDKVVPGNPYSERVVGYDHNGITFLFFQSPTDDEPGLMILGTLGNYLGPTFAYSPDHVKRGMYDKIVGKIEAAYGKKVIPRIQDGGLAPK